MTASQPLKGNELIDCAKANAKQGIATAAKQCGYGDNLDNFKQALQQACQEIGVEITEITDLITTQQRVKQNGGVQIAPDSHSQL